MKSLLISILMASLMTLAVGQSQTASAPARSPSKSIGLFAFPRNGQNADQQLKDETECYGAAKRQTGIDPQKPAPAAPTAEQVQAAQKQAADNAQQAKGGRAVGAARGAAGGAAIGAIVGDAGTGAGAGAVAGTMRGGMQQRSANKQTKQQASQQATAQLQKEHEQEMLGA